MPRSRQFRGPIALCVFCLTAVLSAGGLFARSGQQLAPAGGPAPARQQPPLYSETEIRALAERQSVSAVFKSLDAQYDQMLRDVQTITEIPAPSFKEQARAKWVLDRFQREPGLKNPHIDEEGNVVAERPGLNGGPTLVIAAHLDTVFPADTDLRVKKEGTIWSAPGIGDDSYAVAALISLAQAMEAAHIRTRGNIIFVANVGEEGLGNLRGTRYLFEKSPLRRRIDMFVSIDGPDDSVIVNGAVASKRYRVTFRGPGGHSYGAFGIVNPGYALAQAVNHLNRIRPPRHPKTTYNVGSYGGGTSVNSIPSSVWMEVDLRSESSAELKKLEQQFMNAMQLGVADENRTHRTDQGSVNVETKLIGERRGGLTPFTSPIVQTAVAIDLAAGKTPLLQSSSTDSNVPISLGIPAITVGAGTRGGRQHSLAEWIDVDRNLAVPGLQRLMLLTLALSSVE